jgi:hypothetical protein
MQPKTRAVCRTGCKGKNPGKEEEMNTPVILLFPIAIIVVVFAFTGVVHWVDSSRKEREAFYRAETLKRLAEAPGEGAKAAVELMREDERIKRLKAREGLKIAGLINIGVGIALLIFLRALVGVNVSLCGLIPGLIGVAMLVYVFFMAPPLQ